jgi:hypothetical protein
MPASARMTSNRPGNFPSRVSDQELCPAAGILQVHHKVPGGLRHPGRRRVGGGAQNPDSPAGVLDHREHVQPHSGQGDRLEEVTGQQGPGLGAQEIGPRGGTALGCRVDPGLVQDFPDGGSGDLYHKNQQLAVHPAIPPAGILADQPQHQDADRARCAAGPGAGAGTAGRAGVRPDRGTSGARYPGAPPSAVPQARPSGAGAAAPPATPDHPG